MKTLRSSANFVLTCIVGASLLLGFPSKSLAGRGLGADKEQVNVYAINSTSTKGLKLVKGWISYSDGDVLSGVFRIYCPTSMIRPTGYTLKDQKGRIKRSANGGIRPLAQSGKSSVSLLDMPVVIAILGIFSSLIE